MWYSYVWLLEGGIFLALMHSNGHSDFQLFLWNYLKEETYAFHFSIAILCHSFEYIPFSKHCSRCMEAHTPILSSFWDFQMLFMQFPSKAAFLPQTCHKTDVFGSGGKIADKNITWSNLFPNILILVHLHHKWIKPAFLCQPHPVVFHHWIYNKDTQLFIALVFNALTAHYSRCPYNNPARQGSTVLLQLDRLRMRKRGWAKTTYRLHGSDESVRRALPVQQLSLLITVLQLMQLKNEFKNIWCLPGLTIITMLLGWHVETIASVWRYRKVQIFQT